MLGPTERPEAPPMPTVGWSAPNASVLAGLLEGRDAVTTDHGYSLRAPGFVKSTRIASRSTPKVYTLMVNAIGWLFFVGISGGPKAALPVPMFTTSARYQPELSPDPWFLVAE